VFTIQAITTLTLKAHIIISPDPGTGHTNLNSLDLSLMRFKTVKGLRFIKTI